MTAPSRILHVYPALAVTTPLPRVAPVAVRIAGHAFWVFRGYNVYLDSQALVIRFEREAADSYFIEITPGVITHVGRVSQDWLDPVGNKRGSDAGMRARLLHVAEWGANTGKTFLEILPAFICNNMTVYGDMEGYTLRARAAIAEKRRLAEIERAAEQQSRVARERAAYEARTAADALTFANGGYITWDGFETLCGLYGVSLHIRTIGTGRKRVSQVSLGGLKGQGGAVGDGLWSAVRALGDAVTHDRVAKGVIEGSGAEVAA